MSKYVNLICAYIKLQYSRRNKSKHRPTIQKICLLCSCSCMVKHRAMRAITEIFFASHQAANECSSLSVPCCNVRCSTSLCNRQFIGADLFLANRLLANNSLNQEFTRFNSSEDVDSYTGIWIYVIHVRVLVDNYTIQHQQNT